MDTKPRHRLITSPKLWTIVTGMASSKICINLRNNEKEQEMHANQTMSFLVLQ